MQRAGFVRSVIALALLVAGTAAFSYYQSGIPQFEPPAINAEVRTPAPDVLGRGPLRVDPSNPRYFADGTGRTVMLVGDHTWSNFQDNGPGDPPAAFDYERYLDFLEANGINFFRLWCWEQSRWAPWTRSDDYYFHPGPPFERTGPGAALDGKPKFDLDKLDPQYFLRLRERVQQAGRRGIYVAVMLFNGWAIDNEHSQLRRGNPWHGHPFNRHNNVNSIDGDPNGNDGGEETHQLIEARITAYQDAYVRRVVDVLNDLDNVLYEISNESYSSSKQWQYHMIDLIHEYEAAKPNQHPVGMSQYQWPGSNSDLFESRADWVSPWEELPHHPYRQDPPVADGRKVVIVDTDHLWGIGGDRSWAWKSFLRGAQPSFMDGYDGASVGCGAPAPWDIRDAGLKEIIKDVLGIAPRAQGWEPEAEQWVSLRANLGYIREWAERIDLARMQPRPELSSTNYCLARVSPRSAEFLIYLENSSRAVEVDLSQVTGRLMPQWFDPGSGMRVDGNPIDGGSRRTLSSPFAGDAVLYLKTSQPAGRNVATD